MTKNYSNESFRESLVTLGHCRMNEKTLNYLVFTKIKSNHDEIERNVTGVEKNDVFEGSNSL